MELYLEDVIIKAYGQTFTCTKLPAQMQQILDQGGLIASLNKEDKTMGMTMAEKIIACAAGVESAKAGDIHTVELDRLMSND